MSCFENMCLSKNDVLFLNKGKVLFLNKSNVLLLAAPVLNILVGTGHVNVRNDRGIILCFLWTVGFDLFVFTVQNPLVSCGRTKTCFNVDCLFAKIHHAQVMKGFIFLRFPVWTDSYLFEIPI